MIVFILPKRFERKILYPIILFVCCLKNAWELYRNIESNRSPTKDIESTGKPKKLLQRKKNNPSKHLIGNFNGERNVDATLPIDEVGEYLEQKAIPYDSDVFLNWKSKAAQWPRLSRMAKDYLAPIATSAPSECTFSTGRDLLGIKSYRLRPKTMQTSICLRSWDHAETFNK